MQYFYYRDHTGIHGPLSVEALKQQGISPETLVKSADGGDWRPAAEFSELSALFQTSAPPPPPPPTQTSREYFYIIGQEQKGPFSLEALRRENLSRVSMVWYEGLDGWTEAQKMPELRDLFGASAGSANYGSNSSNTLDGGTYSASQYAANIPSQPMPPNNMVLAILCTVLCCMPLGIVSLIYASKVESHYKNGDYNAALDASKSAKNWAIGGMVGSGIFFALYFLLIIVVAVAGG